MLFLGKSVVCKCKCMKKKKKNLFSVFKKNFFFRLKYKVKTGLQICWDGKKRLIYLKINDFFICIFLCLVFSFIYLFALIHLLFIYLHFGIINVYFVYKKN